MTKVSRPRTGGAAATGQVTVGTLVDSAGTDEARTALESGVTLQGDGAGQALPPVEPQAPPPAPHEWNDEYVGVGGSYVVINGKRVPADQA